MPLPAPLPLWAKAALYLAPWAFAAGEALFEHFSETANAEALAWLHVVYSGTRQTPTGTTEDRAQITFDVVKLSGGENDATWDTSQVTGALTHLNGIVNAISGYQDNNFTWAETRCYVRRFNELGPGFANMGDPVYTVATGWPGTSSATNVLPYQVALSVTERTTLRKHWGRFYIPCPSTSALDGYGRWTSATCSAIAGIVGDGYEALGNANYLAVVPSGASRTLFSVTQVQVDDIPDVQRRRRARTTLIRATNTP